MKHAIRTDCHRPGALIPEDYVEVLQFSYPGADGTPGDNLEFLAAMRTGEPQRVRWPGWGPPPPSWEPATIVHEKVPFFRKANGKGGCDCCGANYRFGSVLRHKPTGEHITIGHTCAEKIGILYDVAGAARMRRAAADRSLRRRKILARWARLTRWARAHRELARLLSLEHPIVKDIRARLVSTGAEWGLSERQEALIRKLAAKVARPAEKLVPAPIVPGRQRVEGTVVSVKTHESAYGDSLKVTVKVETPEGSWLAWGTLPASLELDAETAWRDEHAPINADGVRPQHRLPSLADLLRGRKVAFDAALKAGRDAHFALFSRPTKAELLG